MRCGIPVLLVLVLALPVAPTWAGKLSYDQLPIPMYGNRPRTAQEQAADTKLIQTVLSITGGDREAGAKEALKTGFQLCETGDLDTAIKRFNQAWLLIPNYPPVFHAFGWYMAKRGEVDEAITMYKKALALDAKYAIAMCDLARSYKDKALTQTAPEEMLALLSKAVTLCDEASRATTDDDNLSYIYYQWATLLALTKNYPEAWKKIHLSRKYGGKYIEDGFTQQLSTRMSEPKND